MQKEAAIQSNQSIEAPPPDRILQRCCSSSLRLANGEVLTEYSVIVGRGNAPKRSVGNKRLEESATSLLAEYAAAGSAKLAKSKIVSQVVSMVHEEGGYFVKKGDDGVFHRCRDKIAREKVGLRYHFLCLTNSTFHCTRCRRVSNQSSCLFKIAIWF